jgi:hypothetical protein
MAGSHAGPRLHIRRRGSSLSAAVPCVAAITGGRM